MIMKFYNNIFASAYRSYDKYEKSPRYRAGSFLFVYMLSSFSLILAIIKKAFALNFSVVRNYPGYQVLSLLIGFFFLILIWKYYTNDKIETIIKDFEAKPTGERKLWGFIAVITFILQWVGFIFLI